ALVVAGEQQVADRLLALRRRNLRRLAELRGDSPVAADVRRLGAHKPLGLGVEDDADRALQPRRERIGEELRVALVVDWTLLRARRQRAREGLIPGIGLGRGPLQGLADDVLRLDARTEDAARNARDFGLLRRQRPGAGERRRGADALQPRSCKPIP